MSTERMSPLRYNGEEASQKDEFNEQAAHPKRCLVRSAPGAYPANHTLHVPGATKKSVCKHEPLLVSASSSGF